MYSYIIVDDEGLIRKGTIAKLMPFFDQIKCAGEACDGEQALKLMRRVNPDIVITDMNMPGMDGSQFLTRLMEEYGDKQVIVISGYKDFEYARQAIEAKAVGYLLKPFSKEDIQQAVLKSITNIRENNSARTDIADIGARVEQTRYENDLKMLSRLLITDEAPTEELTSDKLQLINRNHEYALIAIYSETAIPPQAVYEYMRAGGFGNLALYLKFPLSECLGFFILFSPKNKAINSHAMNRQVAGGLRTVLEIELPGQELLFASSEIHGNLPEIRKAAQECILALNTRQLRQSEQIYSGGTSLKKEYPVNWAREREFLFRLEAGEQSKVSELMADFFGELREMKQLRLIDAKNYCLRLGDYTRAILHNYFSRRDSLIASSVTQTVLETIFTLGVLKEYYINLFVNIAVALKEDSVYAINDTVEKMQIYVRHNYKNELSVDLLADLFYMNRSYCSHLFKAQTGRKFVDFVNSVRVGHAKELLLATDKKMYQIAKAVGYDNVKYFFRIFKSMEGVTPEQYRIQAMTR